MSTTGMDSWAVDLANVTLIYPFQGFEWPMAIIGIVLWLLWHIWQIPFESREFRSEVEKYSDPETIRKAIDEGN